jgi:hypothetical protein
VRSELTGVTTWEDRVWRAAAIACAVSELDRLAVTGDRRPATIRTSGRGPR